MTEYTLDAVDRQNQQDEQLSQTEDNKPQDAAPQSKSTNTTKPAENKST